MYAVAAAAQFRRPAIRESGAGYGHAGEPGRPPGPIPERLLAQLWQKRAARRAALYDSGGRKVRVLYPGRPGGGPGPDFRDALLEVEGLGLVRGDVEIHRRQRDWDAHGHGQDPGYNGVVLHAALEVDDQVTRLSSGQPVPVVSLGPLLAEDPSEGLPEGPHEESHLWERLERQGYPRPVSGDQLGALLDRAGDARFLAKSALLQKFLGEQSPDQTLYEAVMEALGYRRNQQAFLKLAVRAPYAALCPAALALPSPQRAVAMAGWLLNLSGLPAEPLRPSMQAEGGPLPMPKAGFGAPLNAAQWRTAGVRPANHPRWRVAGAAGLLDRFLEPGLVVGLGGVVREGAPRTLLRALTVRSPGGPPGGAGAALIGPGRAGDIAVNVVLPFLGGMAQLEGDPRQAQHCARLYGKFSRLQDNELTREMAQQLMPVEWLQAVNTARRQQGLLHLHHLLAGGG